MASGEAYTIADDFDEVLDFLQAVKVKVTAVAADPLSLSTDNCARVWFRMWATQHLAPLYTPVTAAPQYH